MRDLISTDLFTGVEETIRTGISQLMEKRQRISIISDANLLGALSIAPLEASFIDCNLPYMRRIGSINYSVPENSIIIHNNGGEKGVSWDNEKNILSISETLSPALSGHLGDDKIGPLTTVAMCHSIAQLISPSGVLVRKIRPWAISGNWIHACMDMTYDPVYVSLKELLTLEGTSRLEEIVWNCILASGWQVDLASQIRASPIIWKNRNPKIAASEAIDMLLRFGRL